MFNRRSYRFLLTSGSVHTLRMIFTVVKKMDLDKKIEAEEIQKFEGVITAIDKIENRRSERIGKRNFENKKVVA